MKGLDDVIKYIDLVKVYTYYAKGLTDEQYEDLLNGLKNYLAIAHDDYSGSNLSDGEIIKIEKGNVITNIKYQNSRVKISNKFDVKLSLDETLTLDYFYIFNEDYSFMLDVFKKSK